MQIFLKIIYFIVPATAAILLIIGLIEPHLLKIERISWINNSDSTSLDKTARLRLILLSDLHAEFNYVRLSKLIAQIRQAKPDLILFAGDWVGPKRKGTLNKAHKWQIELSKTAASLGVDLLAIAGNHDDEIIRSRLDQPDSGVKLLVNESMLVTSADGSNWQIIGIDDLKHGQPEIPKKLLDVPAARSIIAAHNPDMLLHLPDCPGDYFLSGHFHGGQIWAPGKLEFKLFRREKIAAMGFHRGEFKYGGKTCYISRGLGCVVMPIRLFSLPEMTIIDIEAASSKYEK